MLNPGIVSDLTKRLDKYLQKNSIQEKDIPAIQPILDLIIMNFPLPLYKFIPAQLNRLTINKKVPPYTDERINEIKYIKQPDRKYVSKYGRCNVIDNPVLYGGFNLLSIFNEMRPEIGSIVTASQWKVKEEKTLNFFPIFFITQFEDDPHNSLSLDIKILHKNYTAGFSSGERVSYDLAMEFFAKCFAKEVEESNHFDYYLSAYISKKIFDHPTLNYEGIVYPSVQCDLGVSNMAIRSDVFDSKFIPIDVRHELNSIPPKKSGINNVICWTDKFDLENGLILWKE